MPRTYKKIDCSKTDIMELHRLSADPANPRLALRAQIVLGCIEGKQIKDIAAELHERPNTVILWRDRFSEHGIRGLSNLPRGHGASKYGPDLKERIRTKLNTPPPNGRARWTGTALSEELAVPPDVVWRCLRKENIKLTGTRPEIVCKDALPPEMDHEIPPVISVKEDARMSGRKSDTDKCPAERMDLVLTARVTGRDGTVIEKEIRMEDALPGIRDFDISTKEGFLRDFDEVEKSMLLARGQLTEDVTREYLDAVSKKNKKKR